MLYFIVGVTFGAPTFDSITYMCIGKKLARSGCLKVREVGLKPECCLFNHPDQRDITKLSCRHPPGVSVK